MTTKRRNQKFPQKPQEGGERKTEERRPSVALSKMQEQPAETLGPPIYQDEFESPFLGKMQTQDS